jgi:hypothetical protein
MTETSAAVHVQANQPTEDTLASLARFAARASSSPLASIALTSEYRTRCGPSAWIESAVYRRESSLAAWVLLGGKTLIVNDLAEDERLRGHKDVTELGVRAFAGVPIVAPSGSVIGCVSVRDTRPRRFGAAEVETLGMVAQIAARDLEIRGIESQQTETASRGGWRAAWRALGGCSVVVVGPESEADDVRMMLERSGAAVRTIDDEAAAMHAVLNEPWHALILHDRGTPSGLPVALRGAGSAIPVLLITGPSGVFDPAESVYDEVLMGPVDEETLVTSLVRHLMKVSAT